MLVYYFTFGRWYKSEKFNVEKSYIKDILPLSPSKWQS